MWRSAGIPFNFNKLQLNPDGKSGDKAGMIRSAAAGSLLLGILANSAMENRLCAEGEACFSQRGADTEATVQISRIRGGDSCDAAAELAEIHASERARALCEQDTGRACLLKGDVSIELKGSLLRCSATARLQYQPQDFKPSGTLYNATGRLPNDTNEILAHFDPVGLTPTLAPAVAAAAQALEQEDGRTPASQVTVAQEAAPSTPEKSGPGSAL